MFKNLSATGLGITGRQSELIELALTYKFKGLDVDIDDLVSRAESQGIARAGRYLESADIRIGGFNLPVRLDGSDDEYQADLAKLPKIAEIAGAVSAKRCFTLIDPASDSLPYHENFEQKRKRLGQIADVLDKQDIRLGVGVIADAAARQDRQFRFIHQAETLLFLLKSISADNIGLLLDTWHWSVGGGGLDQLRELSATQIVIVRLADVPPDADFATIEVKQRLLPGESETSELPEVVGWLEEAGYEGPITPYPHPSQFSGMTRDAIVQRASNAMDKLWKAGGLVTPGKVAVAAASS